MGDQDSVCFDLRVAEAAEASLVQPDRLPAAGATRVTAGVPPRDRVGIAGSTTVEDYAAIGGQVAVKGHVRIGMGAQIAATSGVNGDVPAGARWGGIPARPMREWFREITALKKLASGDNSAKDDDASS